MKLLHSAMLIILLGVLAVSAHSQASPSERSFPQSKATIEAALKSLQASMSGRLPVLDGFAKLAEHPLDRYRRGYYQCNVEVNPNPSGGSIVHVSAKVTAWYADPASVHAGYQLLISNGRLEADVLDQLEEQLAKNRESTPAASAVASSVEAPKQANGSPETAVPSPQPSVDRAFNSWSHPPLTGPISGPPSPKNTSPLQAEYDSLQEILKNTGHPKNLVAVKKSGTPVVSTPSLTAKPQFLASAHDEFELLDFNSDWVHVRISGLSRGWIWRNSVEMPEGIADTDGAAVGTSLVSAADLFHVIREETAPFPGDWQPLRSQNVRIISVQKADENAKRGGSQERLEYAKFLLEKSYKEIAEKTQAIKGIVVIFDSADGGMIAATNSTLEQWITGKLTDSALWHQCFFDPPEIFDSAQASASK